MDKFFLLPPTAVVSFCAGNATSDNSGSAFDDQYSAFIMSLRAFLRF